MTDETHTDNGNSAPEYPADLVAAVTAAQLAHCTETVPEALQLRLAAAVEVPAGQWRRQAGADDPRVVELEAPHKRLPPREPSTTPGKSRTKKATGSRRRRSTQ